MDSTLRIQPLLPAKRSEYRRQKQEAANPFPISSATIEKQRVDPIRVYGTKLSECTEPVFDVHYAVDIGIVLSGKIRRFYPHQTIDYPQGQIWFTGIWEQQGWQVIQAPCDLLILTISPDFLSRFRFEEEPSLHLLSPFLAPSFQRPKVSPEDRSEMIELANRFRQLQRNPRPAQNTLYKITLLELLARVLLAWQEQRSGSGESADGVSQINPALKLVFTQHRYIRVEEAAFACSLPVHQFNRIFQSMAHLSFAKFALHYRLNGVMASLLKTDTPLKTISYEWGFKHLSQLDRCFRRYVGCTPRQFISQRTRQSRICCREKKALDLLSNSNGN